MVTLRGLEKEPPEIIDAFYETLTDEDIEALSFDWQFWAREDQVGPRDPEALIWFIMTGRGWGKTRTAAEWIREMVITQGYRRPAIVGRNAADVRDIMIEGPSGILTLSHPHEILDYEPSRKKIFWANGAIGSVYYGSEPRSLRGPEHDIAWCDEIAYWQYPKEAYMNLEMGLRIGHAPRVVVSCTPRPTKFIRSFAKRPDVSITKGKTSDNEDNLTPTFLNSIRREYAGTRLGRQELDGQLLDDNPNALWLREWIDHGRVSNFMDPGPDGKTPTIPDMWKMAVGVDPAVTANEDSNETGIIVAGIGDAMPGMRFADEPHYYVFEDVTQTQARPKEWRDAVVMAYEKWDADRVIGEVNNGGDLVEENVPRPFLGVHASRGKAVRAEPVSTLYEQGRVHHVGNFTELEDQLCEWEPTMDESPDRLDALVWVVTWLKQGGGTQLTAPEFGANTFGL